MNSNPATIMTDPGMADATYIEPLTPQVMEEIIAQARRMPSCPTSAASLVSPVSNLPHVGILEKYGVELIGVTVDAIRNAARTA